MKPRLLDHIRRRKMWRMRALQAAKELVRQSTLGSADMVRGDLAVACKKVDVWFGRRAPLVFRAIQRRVFL